MSEDETSSGHEDEDVRANVDDPNDDDPKVDEPKLDVPKSAFSFDPRAAIDAYLSAAQPDFSQIGRDAARRMEEAVSNPEFHKEALASIQASIKRMRVQTGDLDALLKPKAERVIQANTQWIEADQKKLKALADGHSEKVAELEREQQSIDQELDMFAIMQAIQASTAETARILGEIQAARELAKAEADNQAKFNKAMAWAAILLAGGSIVVGIMMPFVEDAHLTDRPVVVQMAAPTASTPAQSNICTSKALRRFVNC